ncbi:ABC transporter permease, partial [Candidatus Pacearchaeota archaeon]
RKPINFQHQPLSASTTGTRVTLLASPPQKPALYVAGQSGKSQVQFSPSFSTTGLLREAGIGLFDLVFPSFVVLFCVLEALLTGAVLTLRERASGAYIRNMTSKASKFGLMFGLFSTIFLIVFVQLFVLVLSSQFFLNLGGSALIKTIAVLFYVAVLLIPFVLVGMLIGYSLNSQEGVIISAIGVALLITIFSPLIIPTETLPKQIGALLSLTPPIVADQKIVLISVFNRIPLYNSLELFSHSFFVAALTAILFFVFRARKNKEV